MIPKIIHYCWFGNNEKPDLVKDCLESWIKYLPDYEIIEWNDSNISFTNSFVKKAYDLKKWAFVSDYVRLEKIHEYGGVYLDTDMLLIKNIDNLLDNNIFMGSENVFTINAAIFGACKNHYFVKKLLIKYDTIKISNFTNLYDIAIPKIVTQEFRKEFNYTGKFNELITINSFVIYPSEYFYSLPSSNGIDKKDYKKFLTNNSYAVHLWGESWISPNEFELIRKKQYVKGFKQMFYSFNHQENKLKYCRKILSVIKESIC